jgi:hypothetical protein
MAISFRLNDTGPAVADLQRKLASLDRRDVPEIAALQQQRCAAADGATGPCAIYDATLAAAINGFKRRYGLGEEDGVCDAATWQALNLQAGSVFTEVWQYELDALAAAPDFNTPDSTAPAAPTAVAPTAPGLAARAHAQQLAGLAFSGGGIRSATFNLGILQALAELRVLRNVDYLSTVSGGGYIGAWLSRWLHRERGDIATIEDALTPGSKASPHGEADEVKFLRQYTNYLTPRTGFFSADTWALLATYVRNTTLNMAILVALLAAVMVVPRLLATFVRDASASMPGVPWFATVGLVCMLWTVGMIAANISSRPDRTQHNLLLGQGQFNVILFIILPLMVAGCTGSIALWAHRGAIAEAVHNLDPRLLQWILGAGVIYFCAWAAGWGGAQLYNVRHRVPGTPRRPLSARALIVAGAGHFLCAVTALGVGTTAVLALTAWLAGMAGGVADMTVPLVAFGMPVLCSTFGFTMVLCVGLVGRNYSDQSREWWSRQSGWTTIIVSGWVTLVALSLYAPGLLAWVHAQSRGWMSALLATGWVGVTLTGLLVGHGSQGAGNGAGAGNGNGNGNGALDAVARAAPLVFSMGALCLVSTLLQHALPGAVAAIDAQASLASVLAAYDVQTLAVGWRTLVVIASLLALAGALLAWRVDINKFSLHMMYRNRLVRAYLGASNTEREPHPFTGFDPNDDLEMAALMAPAAEGPMQRPYHIVNTALNLVKGKELAWQTRKAAGYAFMPAFCGFELPRMAAPGGTRLAQEAMRGCFRPTASYTTSGQATADDGGVHLGMAMAVSGAAASPSMGFHSSPPLAFLMTLFNVRLGRWFANPTMRVRQVDGQPVPPPTSPPVGIWYLLRELFGLTDARSPYLYLSDGGHFENLGVYELVRRRCRLVIAVDAGADSQFDFSDLGNAIRKCATDLNVEIEIDVSRIEVVKQTEFSGAHCVTGRIRYDKIDEGGEVGTLLYIKPSLTGNEFADIVNYRKTNKTFPHQSTADQWFDETQFETYRSLGYNIGKIVMEPTVAAAAPREGMPGRLDIASLCAALHAWWDSDAAAERKLFVVGERRSAERRRTLDQPLTAPERRQSERRA